MPRSWYSATIHPQGRALASPGNTENVVSRVASDSNGSASGSRVACTKEAATQNQLPDIRPDLTVASWLLAIVLQQAKSPAAACSWQQNHPRLLVRGKINRG